MRLCTTPDNRMEGARKEYAAETLTGIYNNSGTVSLHSGWLASIGLFQPSNVSVTQMYPAEQVLDPCRARV